MYKLKSNQLLSNSGTQAPTIIVSRPFDTLKVLIVLELLDIHCLMYNDWKSSSAPLAVDWFWTETSVEQF